MSASDRAHLGEGPTTEIRRERWRIAVAVIEPLLAANPGWKCKDAVKHLKEQNAVPPSPAFPTHEELTGLIFAEVVGGDELRAEFMADEDHWRKAEVLASRAPPLQ